jgi:hypothetical protein
VLQQAELAGQRKGTRVSPAPEVGDLTSHVGAVGANSPLYSAVTCSAARSTGNRQRAS